MIPKKKLLAAAVAMAITAPVWADPPANTDLPDVFCFRITDVERVAGDAEADRFLFEFEVLNWTNQFAAGISLATNVGTSAGVTLVAPSVDADGRGGPNDTAFDNIGNPNPAGTTSHQSGRGRSDLPGHLNDWTVLSNSPTSAVWSALDGTANLVGTQIPNQDLLFGGKGGGGGQVPGTGLDALGDTAIDGGPGPYTPGPQDGDPQVAGAPPVPDGSGNVLDGFVIDIDGFGEGDTLSFNWNLLGTFGGYGGASSAPGLIDYGGFCDDDPAACLFSIGTQFGGNTFGFGTISLARVAPGAALPGALFTGNSGFNQNPATFFGDVWNVPNPTDFGGEFGAGQTAPFMDPADNIFGNVVNTQLTGVPEPSTVGLTVLGLAGLVGHRRRRKTSES